MKKTNYLRNDNELKTELMYRFGLCKLEDLGDIVHSDLASMAKVWKIGVSCKAIAEHMGFKCHKTVRRYIDLTIKHGSIGAHKILCRNIQRHGYFKRNASQEA